MLSNEDEKVCHHVPYQFSYVLLTDGGALLVITNALSEGDFDFGTPTSQLVSIHITHSRPLAELP